MGEELQKLYLQLVENDLSSIRMCRQLMIKLIQKMLERGSVTIKDFNSDDILALEKLQKVAGKQAELRYQIEKVAKASEE